MCLLSAKLIEKPEQDLICYKIFRDCDPLELRGVPFDVTMSLYRDYQFVIGYSMTAHCDYGEAFECDRKNIYRINNTYVSLEYPDIERDILGNVTSGVFHSFKTLEGAVKCYRSNLHYLLTGLMIGKDPLMTIRECIIPKDSDVIFLGMFQGQESYGSSNIIVTNKAIPVKFAEN